MLLNGVLDPFNTALIPQITAGKAGRAHSMLPHRQNRYLVAPTAQKKIQTTQVAFTALRPRRTPSFVIDTHLEVSLKLLQCPLVGREEVHEPGLQLGLDQQ